MGNYASGAQHCTLPTRARGRAVLPGEGQGAADHYQHQQHERHSRQRVCDFFPSGNRSLSGLRSLPLRPIMLTGVIIGAKQTTLSLKPALLG